MTMKTGIIAGSLAVALTAPVAADAGDKHKDKKRDKQQQAALQEISDWPKVSRKAAQAMLEQYGEPDGKTDNLWIWNDNDPWKRTIVSSEPIDHNFPVPHQDVLLQTVNYDVPVDMFDELAAYDGSVIVERTAGEMSARCDKEGANKLALNLAHQIVEGEKTVEEARNEYAETIRSFMQQKQMPDMMQSIAFDVPRRNTEDPDKAVIQVAGR